MAAVPQVGRATGVEERVAPEAAATQDLYERYAGQIFTFCLHRLGSREEAEDAVQQTFLNAFRGLRRGIDVETESAWLFKIAHNVCLTRRRSAWRRGKVETPNDLEALQEYVAAPPKMGTDDLIQLQDALAAMPPTQRRAILLREWQGLSYHEIAEEMEISQAAVETLIFRARRTLAQGLEQAPGERRGWRRLRHTLDVGALLSGLVSGTVAKVAATTAAVTALAVVPAGVEQNRIHAGAEPTAVTKQPVVAAKASAQVPAPVVEASAPVVAAKVEPHRSVKADSKPPAPVPAAEAAVAEAPDVEAPAPAAEPPAPAPQPVEAPKAEEPAVEQPQVEVAPEQPAPAPTPAQPRGTGKAKGKDKQAERAPQASDPPAVEAPVVEEPVAAEPPAAEPEHDGGKPDDKPEKDKKR